MGNPATDVLFSFLAPPPIPIFKNQIWPSLLGLIYSWIHSLPYKWEHLLDEFSSAALNPQQTWLYAHRYHRNKLDPIVSINIKWVPYKFAKILVCQKLYLHFYKNISYEWRYLFWLQRFDNPKEIRSARYVG